MQRASTKTTNTFSEFENARKRMFHNNRFKMLNDFLASSVYLCFTGIIFIAYSEAAIRTKPLTNNW